MQVNGFINMQEKEGENMQLTDIQIQYIEYNLGIIKYRDLKECFDHYLDELYGSVEICGYYYESSEALHLIDSVAYECAFNDWLDNECSNNIYIEVNGSHYNYSSVYDLVQEWDDYGERCVYCFEPKGEKISCCGECHFIE